MTNYEGAEDRLAVFYTRRAAASEFLELEPFLGSNSGRELHLTLSQEERTNGG